MPTIKKGKSKNLQLKGEIGFMIYRKLLGSDLMIQENSNVSSSLCLHCIQHIFLKSTINA